MISFLLAAHSFFLAASADGSSVEELDRAFGIDLLSDAGQLPEGFIELQTREPGTYRLYRGSDPDHFFDVLQVSATPLSNRVVRIAAFKVFAGSSSFQVCLNEYRHMLTALQKEYAGLIAVPFFQKDEPDEIVSSGLTTALGKGSFGGLLPWGRWWRISCQAQDEGAVLSVDYNVSSEEQKLGQEEAAQVASTN